MKLWNKKIPYYDDRVEFEPYLSAYVVHGAKTAIVICPGGAYNHRAGHEGNAVGEWLNSVGVSAFVLEYRVAPYRAPVEGADVQRAIRMVRKIADDYGIKQIGVMGFSAGGHLAATVSVHYDKQLYETTDEVDLLSARPDFTVLCYPVIDLHEDRPCESRDNLLGKQPEEVALDFYSPHLHVTKDTPPAFLWHTTEDKGVPARNSMIYAMALAEHNTSYELHIYQGGGHGQGLALTNPYLHRWTDAMVRWMKKMGYLDD